MISRSAHPFPARLNPFRSERLHTIPFLPHPAAENTVIDTLEKNHWMGCIAGPHGSGKTTLLLRLQERMQTKNIPTEFFQCLEDRPSLSSRDWKTIRESRPGSVILLDGAEQLPLLQWLRLRQRPRRGGGLVVSSHRPMRGVPLVYQTDPTPRRLLELIQHLYPEQADQIDTEFLYRRHHGNLRDALRDLYDRCAGKEVGPETL